MIYRLTIYEADDSTTWLQVSTDPDATNPWMMIPEQWADTEVSFVDGSASIGEIVVQVLDPQTGGTQAQRGLTAKLADSTGRSAMSGRRALLEDSVDGSTYRTIFDGVIARVELADSLASFLISIRDIRERERNIELFRYTETCTVLPAGVLNGYGIPYAGAPTSEWLVPPTAPLIGIFRADPAPWGLFGSGRVDVSSYQISVTAQGVPLVREDVVMSEAAIEASTSTGGAPSIRILWRPVGNTGAYTVVNVGGFVVGGIRFIQTVPGVLGSPEGRPVQAATSIRMPNGFGLANTLPNDGQGVEVIVQYIGETSEKWPLHIEEVTAGELIEDIYTGEYSEEDPRVRFDQTSILALNTPVRARITAPVEDGREWIERNLYVAAGAAPAIIGGVVHAVTYELPPATVQLTEIGTAEADVVPGWAQDTDDAVNLVEVLYPRDRSLSPEEPGFDSAAGDRITSEDQPVIDAVLSSIAILGERRQTLRVDVLRAIGGPQGEPYSGDVADETGAQVAKRIAAMMTDRFALGGQTFVVMGNRTLSDIEALKVGDFVLITTPWTPDYQTGNRGGNRVGQVIARRDESPIRCELLIQDAGPDAQPLVAPTLGTITQTDLGEVVVPIATVPSGAIARVDYAISSTQPAAGSALWTFAGRSAASASVTTPQLPTGKTIWLRARSEGVGRRPSGYTTPTNITLNAIPRLRRLFGYVTPSTVEIYWEGNPSVAGVRIDYVQHLADEDPDFDYGDTVDTGTSPQILTDAFDRSPNQVLSFRVTPYPTFGGGSVSGTPGQPLQSSVFIGQPDAIPFGYVVAFLQAEELEFVAQGNQLAAGGEWAVRLGQPPEEPDDPLAEVTGSFQGPFTLEQLTLYADPYNEDVWVGVWFYDDFDSEPTGLRGPRVLAKAIEQPLPGSLQPDLVVRVEYDEASDDPIARVIATVTDPFLRARAVDPMTAYVDTGPIDEIPELTDAAWIAQPIETSGPYAGSYVWEVVLTEKHLSVAALAFYWLDADGTERVINQVLWLDIGDDANIVSINVSYDDRTATVSVKGDADTDELYAEESDDGDPDGTWYAVDTPTPAFTGDRFATSRRGTFSVQTRTDRERFFRVQGRNFDGRFGPFEFFQVDVATEIPFGSVIAAIDDLDLEFVAQGNQYAAGGKWAIRYEDPPTAPDDPNAEQTGSFQGAFSFEQITLTNDPAGDDVWVGVWFYDDYDTAPTGDEGPRVLAKAIEQPLQGTFQPDMVVRVEYDEDNGDPIARVIATVTDPFARARASDPMTAFTSTGPIDEIPELTDAAWVAQPIETSGPYDGSYVWEVALTEKHLSVAALAFYWLDADSTERVINQVLWLDVGDDANIVSVNVSYDDRTATVTVKGDADTDELHAEESDDGNPTGTWYAVVSPTPSFTGNRFASTRRGSFSVQTRIDRERFFRVRGRNPDARFGPFEFFQVDRAPDIVATEPDFVFTDILSLRSTTLRDAFNVQMQFKAKTVVESVELQNFDIGGSPSPSLEEIKVYNRTAWTNLGNDVFAITLRDSSNNIIQFPYDYGANIRVFGLAYDAVDAGGTLLAQDFLTLNEDEFFSGGILLATTTADVATPIINIGSGLSLNTTTATITATGAGVTSIAGTTDQVNASASTGDVTLSLPQSIASTSSPTFNGLTVNGSVGLQAGVASSAATQILVVTDNPALTTRTVVTRTPSQLRGDIGAGTVTSVGGTGTVSGITLTGTVTSSGNLTLGGVLAVQATDIQGTLPVTSGGTGATTAAGARTNLGAVGLSGNESIAGIKTFTGQVALGSLGSAQVSGYLYGGTVAPSSTTRVNYDGNFHATSFIGTSVTADGNISLRAAAGTVAATQILVVTADPVFNTRTIVTRTPAQLRGDIGAGTVTSVSGTGTVSGITLTGTVTSSGSLTLGGVLEVQATDIQGVLPVTSGGTNATTAAGARTNLGAVGLTGNESIAGIKTFTGQIALGSLGSAQVSGYLYGGTVAPSSTTRVNYDGHFHATSFIGTTLTANGNVSLRAAASSSAATQILVVTDNPASTTRTVVTRTPAQLRGDIGAGTVTSVGGTGTVSGITLTGTVTGSGNLTLGGVLAVQATDIQGTLPVTSGGTGATTDTGARTSLGAVGLTGNESIGGVKTFTGNIALGSLGSTRTAGHLYSGTTNPNGTTRTNYDGHFYATQLHSTSSFTFSDRALKNDIADWDGADLIQALSPKQWKWKHDDSEGIGFVAQEVPDAFRSADGLSIDYAKITTALVAMVLKLQAKVEGE